MALSRAQKQILDKFNVPRDLQDWLAQEFNELGEPRAPEAPDFLMAMSDHLQAAETYLDSQRVKLNRIQNLNQETHASPEEWQVLLADYEEVVKEAWLRTTGYWRIIDELISKPDDYGIKLSRQHIDYALQKNNLPLVEMLKWTKPEYFFIPKPNFIISCWSGFWAGLGGTFSGMMGGLVWAIRHTRKQKSWLRPVLLIIQGLRGLLTGSMMGAITAASIGYQIGNITLAIKLGYYAAAYNPFSEPINSRHKQKLDLKIQETLFHLALTKNKTQPLLQTLNQNFSIRPANEENLALILNFIKELAADKKMLSEVTATEATLRESIFGPKAYAEVLLGFVGEEAVACAILFHNYHSILAEPGIFIEDLYIKKSHRGLGLGHKMLSFIAELALKRDCKRVEWFVSTSNSTAGKFYQKLGAKPLKNWIVYRIEREAFEKLAHEGLHQKLKAQQK